MARCSYLIPGKGQCGGVAIRSSDLCAAHDPSTQARRRAGARKGGRSRGTQEIQSIKTEVRALIKDVQSGDASTGRAVVAGQLYNVLLRSIDLGLKVQEQEELLERIEELERKLGA